ncbi:S8 family serine peptidase [Neobacillus massiliamazoniensis]|uniref:Subtilisin-like serine protease n=1 Tax=Neobacillus massiliamazoniensis TaxID=1499688 RepID=A0A0U1NYI7_9BACI|nr:S8 family serine peptidase [Neobacillus massiliamazoniensis]CRK83066.1 subtilisin-like serine protease [Neobacillus massiliamazoniensis]
MKRKKYGRVFSRLLILTLIFSLFTPIFASAETGLSPKGTQVSDESIMKMKALIAQQESLLNQEPSLSPELKDLEGDNEVGVIVQLSEHPLALEKGIKKVQGKSFTSTDRANVKKKIQSQQDNFEKALGNKGIKHKKGFTFSETFNGMSLKLTAKQLKELLKVNGVVSIEPDSEVHAVGEPSTDDTVSQMISSDNQFLGIPDVWAKGYEGQNVKVAVLDTGIDYYHPEFQGVYKGGYNFVPQTSRTDYTRDRADDDPYETSPLDRPAGKAEVDANGRTFYTEHGTHVAGTIAAQGNNPYGIKGIAPKVELYSYRVLGAYGSGATSGIIAAIDKAAQQHMDVINLSLGGSNNSSTSADAIAINNAALAGVTAVVATGNSGPNRGTIGSPSTAAFAISVANSTIPETTKKGQVNVTLEGSAPANYNLNLMAWKFGVEPADTLTGTYDVVAVPNYGVDADYTGLDVKGKVALISRGGGVAFVDKIAAAKKAGAIATIIHNNGGTNGNGPAGVFLSDSFAFLPSFDMSTTDGNALRTAMQTKKATVTFSNFSSSSTGGDDINSSSSRGPSNPNFDLKPDVSAPGTNIMSSVPAYKKDFPDANYTESYERFTGTSMATPHITGIAALLKSEHPDWTPFDIKVAISNTAKQLDVTKYDVFAQGPGRVQPYQAATTEALAYAMDKTAFSSKTYDNIKGTITFGNVPTNANNASTVTKDIKVKNLTGKASDYTVNVQVTKAATGALAGANVTVDQSKFTLDASGEKALKVTLNVPKGAGSTGNEILGYVYITNGTTNLTLPFAGNFAPPTGIKDYSIESKVISPNGDGKLDSTTVHYEFYDRQNTTFIELWDAAHQDAGYYHDGYLGYLVASSSTTVGPKSVVFNGGYTEWGTGKKATAPDGVYTIDMSTLNLAGTAVATSAWLGPIYVKSSPSEFVLPAADNIIEDTSFEYKGSIKDKFIDFKPVVEQVFGENYDVNDKLTLKYELKDKDGNVIDSKPVKLNQDGSFSIPFAELRSGDYKLKFSISDIAQNSSEKEITISVKNDPQIAKMVVTNKDIDQQIKGNTSVVVLATPAFSKSQNKIRVELPTSVLKDLEQSKKSVAFAAPGGVQIMLPTKVMTQLSNSGADKVYLEINRENSSIVPVTGTDEAVSDLYQFAFRYEKGRDTTYVTTLDDTVDVRLPVNATAAKGFKKVEAYDFNKDNKSLNLLNSLYLSGSIEFKATKLSSFVALGKNKK